MEIVESPYDDRFVAQQVVPPFWWGRVVGQTADGERVAVLVLSGAEDEIALVPVEGIEGMLWDVVG